MLNFILTDYIYYNADPIYMDQHMEILYFVFSVYVIYYDW